MKLDSIKLYFFPIFIFLFAITCGVVIKNSVTFVNDNHFTLLAQSFIKNDLFLDSSHLPAGDFADYKGRQYLYFGPLPSVILIPFVLLFGADFGQWIISITALIGVFLLVFLLLRKLKFSQNHSLWLTNFFAFGSVLYFVSLVNISAYLVQVLGMFFVVFSLYEYFGKKRFLLIGISVAMAGATRLTLFGMAAFYVFEILRNYKRLNSLRNLFYLFIPIFFAVLLLGVYNIRRFNSIFDSGYTYNITSEGHVGGNQELGYFGLGHIPANLYAFLIKPPEPVTREGYDFNLKFPYLKANGLGMAIWFTSPLLVYLIKIKRREYTLNAALGIFLLAIPSLIYFGIGTTQYGYRYSLDFFPLIFLLLVSAFEKGLPTFAKVLIVVGIVFNCLYMLSIWNSYPLFWWLN